jgi:hypothetical protein
MSTHQAVRSFYTTVQTGTKPYHCSGSTTTPEQHRFQLRTEFVAEFSLASQAARRDRWLSAGGALEKCAQQLQPRQFRLQGDVPAKAI